MNTCIRKLVLAMTVTSSFASSARAEEPWRVYVVNPTQAVESAIKGVITRWSSGPAGAQSEVSSLDITKFCSLLKESKLALYVASAAAYKGCYSDVPLLGAFDFPYSTRDWRTKISIADGPIGTAYAEGLSRTGVRVMAFWTGDPSVIVSSTPINELKDFKGMFLYTPQSFSSQIFASTTGAKGVARPAPDRFKLLSSPSNLVATQVPLSLYINSPERSHKSVLVSDASFDPVVVATPEKAWESLPPVKQGQLEGVMREVTEAQRRDASNLADADILTLKKRGTGISELSYKERAILNQQQQELTLKQAFTTFSGTTDEVRKASIAQAGGEDQSTYAHVFFVTNRDLRDKFNSSVMSKTLSFGEADVKLAYSSPNFIANTANGVIRFLSSGGEAVKIDWNKVSSSPFDDSLFAAKHQLPSTAPLIFLHGFANDFNDALQGAAWIAWNSKRPVIVFSWPSEGYVTPAAYHDDQKAADNTQDALAQFLSHVANAVNGQTDVDIVVHSMGARVLLGALDKLAANSAPAKQPKFRQLLLVAPDVPKAQLHDEWPRLYSYFERVGTLYSSDHDRALILSRALMNDRNEPRAGFAPPHEIEKNMESVFVGKDEFSVTGHSYLTANGAPATDIMELLRYATEAINRTGIEVAPNQAGYYVLRSVEIP
ncbi:TRAP transporter substrate-binding protein DctP [Paraburkholderia sacchari]|uniref:TRAP transporter substrate-binding protein DctP n=1 Tax=Paraburkholderia sacchari TaxID=159450 RepID=UPI001BCA7922|nr:TRAP transporter substrate-binding protein DctP [Paraburkholderia sacchari]